MKMWNSKCCFLVSLTLTFEVHFTEGIIWITEPSPVNTCIGQTAYFTWKYIKEANEEIKQHQWLFNEKELIASSSAKYGFHVEFKYQGRVDRNGDTGILLKNVTAQDIGNYTLYPLLAWEDSPSIQTIWLDVIEPSMKQECSCETLPISNQWRSGATFSIVVGGCSFEINSSFCCLKRPTIEYCVNDPQKLCVATENFLNVAESTTQSRNINTESNTQTRIVTQQNAPTGHTTLDHLLFDLLCRNNEIVICVLVINCLCLMYILWIHCKIVRSWICCKKVSSKGIWYQEEPSVKETIV